MSLETELETYRKRLPELLRDARGKYAVIHNDHVDVWCCYQDALQAGYRAYGTNLPFLVKQILEMTPTNYTTVTL